MTAKRKATGARARSSLASLQNLGQLIGGVLADTDTPAELRQHIRYALDELFNGLGERSDNVTDSPEYITLLLAEHEVAKKGGE